MRRRLLALTSVAGSAGEGRGCGLRLGGQVEVPGPDPPCGQSARALIEQEGPDRHSGRNNCPFHGIGSLESPQVRGPDSLAADESRDHKQGYLTWNSSVPWDNLRSKGKALPTFSSPARKPSTESLQSTIGELTVLVFPSLSYLKFKIPLEGKRSRPNPSTETLSLSSSKFCLIL